MRKGLFLLFFLCLGFLAFSQNANLLKVRKGSVSFISNAPLEQIEAKTDDLKGLLDLSKGSFASRLNPSSFEGFNGALQKEHFNENFLETSRYPVATFSGKLIDPINMTSENEQVIRVKGILTIHGIEKERIIKVKVRSNEGVAEIHSEFIVPLKDHNISIPRVVHQKIAEDIHVEIKATLSVQ